MTVLAVCFKNKKVVKRVSTKAELTKHYRDKEKGVVTFLQDAKDGLSNKQYMTVLEGIVCHSFYAKITNQTLIKVIEEYYSLI